MTKKNYLPVYTLSEELINSISHGVGTCLSIAALVLCIVQAASTARRPALSRRVFTVFR